VISKRKLGTQQEVQDVQQEVQTLKLLQGHPNIVDLIKVYEDKQNICIVTEYCSGEPSTQQALSPLQEPFRYSELPETRSVVKNSHHSNVGLVCGCSLFATGVRRL
jgi:serine/threonine protein kinase